MTAVAAEFAGVLMGREVEDVVEWSRQLMVPFKVSNSRAGPYRLDDFAYAREILRAMVDPEVREVTGVIGTQGAKSMTGMIAHLYLLDQAPANTLIGISKTDLARSFSRERLQPMIEANEVLRRHKTGNPDDFKTLEMSMDRATIFLGSTGSDSDLISRPCRYVWLDEAQHAPPGAIEDARQRTKTFPFSYKFNLTGTPKGKEQGLWVNFLAGTQEVWTMECPRCGADFSFENEVRADEGAGKEVGVKRVGLCWGADAKVQGQWREELVRESAHYVCPRCEGRIDEVERMGMVRAGRFQAQNVSASGRHRSFRVPSLCSPDVSFGEMAWQFLRAHEDLFGLEKFVEGYWAMPFDAPASRVTEGKVRALCESTYKMGELPIVPRLVAMTADLGERMSHWEVAAHGANGEFWVIDYGTVLSPWDLLRVLFGGKQRGPDGVDVEVAPREYRDPEGKLWRIMTGLVDSGDFTDLAYDVCDASRGVLKPCKGSGAAFGTVTETTIKARPLLRLYTYVDFTVKRSLYLDTIEQGKKPAVHFPGDASPEFLHGHCGQEMVTLVTKWGRQRKFKPVAYDHYGDCTKEQRVVNWWLGGAGR